MAETILRQASDGYVSELEPSKNHSEDGRMRLSSISGARRRAFIFMAGGPRPGTYVVEAQLKVYVKGSWSGSHTLTATRVVESWKERTLTWARQPLTVTTGQAALSVGAKSNRDELVFDVTDIVRAAFLGSGTPFFGFRITDSSTSQVYDIYSSEIDEPALRPRLEISYTEIPTFPYDLVPGDGDVVSIAKPVLRFTYFDADEDEQGSLRIQIDAAIGGFSSPDFDSGTVTTTEPELDLSTTAYGGIADGATVYWRAMVTSAAGQESEWSDPVAISRVSKGTLTINSPTVLTLDSTPEISTTLDGHDQKALAYQLTRSVVFANEDWSLPIWQLQRFRAPVDDGVAYTYEIPKHNVTLKDTPYTLRVRAWDDVPNRVATPGDPIYVEEEVTFEWVEASDAPAAPGTLTITQEVDGPGAVLAWTRSAVPDYWAIVVNGEVVLDKIDAVDLQVDSTHYQLTYYGLEPGTEHTVEVMAIETE